VQMKPHIEHRGGHNDAPLHITHAIKTIPIHWEEVLPKKVTIETVSHIQLPKIPDIWGNKYIIPGHWEIRMVPNDPQKPIRICVFMPQIEAEDIYLFEQDVLTAVIYASFKQKHVYKTVEETVKHWLTRPHNIDARLAGIIAAYIFDYKLATIEYPHMNIFIGALNKEIAVLAGL